MIYACVNKKTKSSYSFHNSKPNNSWPTSRFIQICHLFPYHSVFLFIFFNNNLSKLRWLQATKSIISGTNTQALTAKADLLKEEMDEAMNKVELCKVIGTIQDAF